MSSNDPPLPPTPDEPSDEPLWGSGDVPDESTSDATHGPPDLREEVAATDESNDDIETTGEVSATEPLPETDAETELLAETEAFAETEALPETLAETEELPESLAETDVLPETAAATSVIAETEFIEPSPSEAHRRRVSHRRYVMRRIGVAACLLAIIGGAIALLVWALGDDDGGEAGSNSTTAAGIVPESSAPTAVAETTEPATMTTLAAEPVDGTEATELFGGSPTTAATAAGQGADDTEPAAETSEPDGDDDPDSSTPGESAPPGTVVYDLDSEASCEISQPLQRGDAGPQVECLQERLNDVTVGGAPATVDGAFGEQTEAAVRAFQQANELVVDGIVGPATGELLGIWPNAADAA